MRWKPVLHVTYYVHWKWDTIHPLKQFLGVSAGTFVLHTICIDVILDIFILEFNSEVSSRISEKIQLKTDVALCLLSSKTVNASKRFWVPFSQSIDTPPSPQKNAWKKKKHWLHLKFFAFPFTNTGCVKTIKKWYALIKS